MKEHPHSHPTGGDREALPPCPLCGGGGGRQWRDERQQSYYLCPHCELIYLHPALRPDRDSERARYLEHNNSPENLSYVRYLSDFAERNVFPRLPAGSRILDFGSGPEPVLTGILTSHGYWAEPYDPFFAPQHELPAGSYNGITAVEVAEHLFDPAGEFARLKRLLRPGGLLFLRTELHDGSLEFFSHWWYRRDRSHVVFYSRRTMDSIAAAFELRLLQCSRGKEIVFSA